MGAGHQRAGHQTRLALDGPRYSLTVDIRTLITMTGSGHSCRLGVGRKSGWPQILDMPGPSHIRRDVPGRDIATAFPTPSQVLHSFLTDAPPPVSD